MAAEAPPPSEAPVASMQTTDADAPPQQPVKRSWRRKYRKMRVKFDQAITTSNRLIADEWKAMGTARRLAEGNDQLLDALLDINEQTRAPARLRFNLDPPGTVVPAVAGPDPEVVRKQLHELRDAASTGAITQEDYIARAELLHSSHAIRQTLKSLADLESRVAHSTREDLPGHPLDGLDLSQHAPGYLSPSHEEEYLAALDEVLAQPDFDPSMQEGRPIRTAACHPPLSEKDLTIRNPDSVYNWLRKHQPQVFLQDKDAAHHENTSERSAPKANASSRKSIKRESALGGGTPAPRDNDDEDSVAGETGAKGRRKTTGGGEDDTAYRPKGGSSRPAKRKREDGDTPAAKSKKKSRASTGAAVSVAKSNSEA